MFELAQRAWDFLKSHKKKFIFFTTASAVGVGGYYYAKRMLIDGMRQVEELGRDIQEKVMEMQHRQTELDRIRKECAVMILNFLPPMRSALKQLTDPKPVTEKLKTVRKKGKMSASFSAQDEEEVASLWDELKVISLTRLIGSIYALALLNALLRVQLHVLGRYAFEEAVEQRKSVTKNLSASENKPQLAEVDPIDAQENYEELRKITAAVRERFLFCCSDHLMNSGVGMQLLVNRVSESIRSASKSWLMGTDATIFRKEIIDMMEKIRSQVEGSSSKHDEGFLVDEEARAWIVSCLVPEDESKLFQPDHELDEDQNILCREMVEETLDMVESPVFSLVVEKSFDNLFDVLTKRLHSRHFEVYTRSRNPNDKDRSGEEDRFLLTKVIVNLKLLGSAILSEGGETALQTASDPPTENEFENALNDIHELDQFCSSIFQQGADDTAGNDLDPFGLGALGLGEEDLKSFAGLLGGLDATGASPGGANSEAELMQLLSSIGNGEGSNDPTDVARLARLLDGVKDSSIASDNK